MALSEFQEASRAHAAKLAGLVDRGAVPRLRKLYEAAQSELERKLAKAVGSGASPFTIQQHRALLAQARQGLAHLARTLGTALGEETARAQDAAVLQLVGDIKKLERRATGSIVRLPIEQAARFAGVVDRRRTSLLKLNRESMAKHGAQGVGRIEQALAHALVTGETGYKAVDRVVKAHDMEWWRAERIVRTETAWAYNATQVDAAQATTRVFPDLMMRWTEHVADVTLAKLDDRVGDDSVAMHGQLARPGALFTMPTSNPGLEVGRTLLGKSWANPPNRPNDRAVLQPWRPGWGWGWELVGGQKVYR